MLTEENEKRVAASARELCLGGISFEEDHLILPPAPEGADPQGELARHCVKQAQEELQTFLPLRSQIKLVTELVDRLSRFEAILKLLSNPEVAGVTIGADNRIGYCRGGLGRTTGIRLADEQEALEVYERLLAPRQRAMPQEDDSERAAGEIGPLPGLDGLVARELLTPEAARVLEQCVRERLNIVISGEPGAGRTCTLVALAGLIPEDERVITIEEAPEVILPLRHVVSLSLPTTNPNYRVKPREVVTLSTLVRRTWRMRPDRLVLGECRGKEFYDLLDSIRCTQAATLTTVSARAPDEAISRLEQLAQSAVPEIPVTDVRELLGSTVNVVVHQERLADGRRRITSITELDGVERDELVVRMLFEWESAPEEKGGRVAGTLVATGELPSFLRPHPVPPTPAEAPPADPPSGPGGSGPTFHWHAQVAARGVNPLKSRMLAAQGVRAGTIDCVPDETSAIEERLRVQLIQLLAETSAVSHIFSGPRDWRSMARARVEVEEMMDKLPIVQEEAVSMARRKSIAAAVCDHVLGAGRIQTLLDDPTITAIMINGPSQVMVECGGKMAKTRVTYANDLEVQHFIDRFVPPPPYGHGDADPIAKDKAELTWLREGVLPDGTRLVAILPPASLIGPVVLLRKPAALVAG